MKEFPERGGFREGNQIEALYIKRGKTWRGAGKQRKT